MGFEIGKTVAGYEIVEVLGTSKTGVAYKVRNVFAQRFEVLKILPKSIQDDEEQNARFLREIKVHAQLLHPNIVTFYNAREIEGQLVMTKEFVPGTTLVEKLHAGPIAWREASRYASHALSALEYAHAHGIIHRGFSSADLIITDDGIAKLAGFGFAKSASDPELTAAGVVIGALKYMSPEQVKGEAIDARCDIYSLGIVLYEMLTGRVPFDAKSQFEIMMAQVNTPPKHVSDANAAVPRELGDLVAKALAKSPDERFQTAGEFRQAIERLSVSQDAVVTESKPASSAIAEGADPVAEPAPPPLPAPLPDAWAIESALELAESKLATMELHSAQPVAGSSAIVHPSNHTPADPWLADLNPEPTPVVSAIDTPQLSEVSSTVSAPVDWWTSDVEVAHGESKSTTAILEPEQSVAEPAAFNDAPAIVSSNRLPDVSAVESVEAHSDSKPNGLRTEVEFWPLTAATFELPAEPAQPMVEASTLHEAPAIASSSSLTDAQAIEPAIVATETTPILPQLTSKPESVAAVTEQYIVPQSPVVDWLALSSQVFGVESKSPEVEFSLSPPEPEPAVVADLAHTDLPAINSHTAQADLWTTDWSPTPVESKAESAQLELLSAALEPVNASLDSMTVAESPASYSSASHPDLWAAEPLPSTPESNSFPADLALSSFAQESKQLALQHEEAAEEPLSLWTSGPPDTWVAEQAAPKPEAPDLQSLSAALEAPMASVETAAPVDASVPPPMQEPHVLGSEPVATEPAMPPVAENSPPTAPEAAAASAPAPVAPAPAQVNSDLLTALFGDTLLSRVSLALVICAITFFLGTVALFAVLSVTKP